MGKKAEFIEENEQMPEEPNTPKQDPYILSLEKELLELKKVNAYLVKRLDYYEQSGPSNLLFSLNRKANEMAVLLNKTDISNISLSDKDDKTFDRLKITWGEAGSISNNIKVLEALSKSGSLNGELDKEPKDETMIEIANRPILSPEGIADAVGELAGKKY